ncbi:MAG TPA: deoxyribodipyrimidine photo-lyase [Catalimonadaceae bacterium]|nr:deoxyribodipyrimidine photo-lyase [Catalimonadaceae bacterium]
MNQKETLSVFWFRRDLRLDDNAGLFHALSQSEAVLPIFIFDRNILDKLEDRSDRRLVFIHQALSKIDTELRQLGSGLKTYFGNPEEIFPEILKEFNVAAVYTNHDYETYARTRDEKIGDLLKEQGVAFYTFKDQVIFEKDEILSGSGTPYTVFTPYSKKWKETFKPEMVKAFASKELISKCFKWEAKSIHSLESMNFREMQLDFPPMLVKDELLRNYGEKRDFPSLPATSRLSVHLRFGTVSIRTLVSRALPLSETWLNELIWREFYMNILWHFPHVGEGKAFRQAYDRIEWRNNEAEFSTWCEGKTGYPIVDAGMRELNETGFMHNRVRMIVASFLVKHLLIDWRWGEAYFAKKLQDFDFSANNGGWQWAAGSGCDAAPYFRVFNPTLQTEKFDKQWVYIKKWVPEWNDLSYLQKPVVNHEFARKRVLEVYKKALAVE